MFSSLCTHNSQQQLENIGIIRESEYSTLFRYRNNVDLVFYNYILKCFILIDLKTTRITHQDVGQMDMYVRMYDELKRNEGDNPTIGILLCSETDKDTAQYSILGRN